MNVLRGVAGLLDRKRLAASGLRTRLSVDLLAIPILYLVIPLVANVAQIAGWRQGRQSRRADLSRGLTSNGD